MRVEVIYPLPDQQVLHLVDLADGATVKDAIVASGILALHPELDLDLIKVGIFSKLTQLGQTLREGDRVEIYRPLIADPKEVRRKKAAEKAATKAAEKVKG
ncbi:MAG: RnfH family protein [Kangiellaceae bacterium]|jgi:putative ubiquitin-RnfH superfamily antitoxin RatB of RatAB toxin-antitoxin module|nr:RnfH family protein [Kangiellaceae bacterium]